MKKFTLLFMLMAAFSYAQQPQTFTDLETINVENNISTSNSELTVTRVNNNRTPVIEVYTVKVDFETAYDAMCNIPGGLFSENFGGGPAGITTCGLIISSAGDNCFPAGELEDGFNVIASNSTETVFIPQGAIGNLEELVGANVFSEITIINFPDNNVSAVGLILWNNNDPLIDFRVYGMGDVLLETYNLNNPIATENFFGFIADEVIIRVEIEGINGSGELFGQLLFGDCNILSVEDTIYDLVSVYPNPTFDLLHIEINPSIEILNSHLYDILGKETGVKINNGSMNLTNLARGIYILNVKTTGGTLIQKIIKQ